MIDLQVWLDVMEERYYELKSFLPKNISDELNFKIESLDYLESYILDTYKTTDEFLEADSKTLIRDKMARYFGEVARLNVEKCAWYIQREDKKSIYFDIPVIYVVSPGRCIDSPYHKITASIHRKNGNFLKKMIINYKRLSTEGDQLEIFENPYKMPVYH